MGENVKLNVAAGGIRDAAESSAMRRVEMELGPLSASRETMSSKTSGGIGASMTERSREGTRKGAARGGECDRSWWRDPAPGIK